MKVLGLKPTCQAMTWHRTAFGQVIAGEIDTRSGSLLHPATMSAKHTSSARAI